MNELGHGLSISKPSLEENVKTKKCKSFKKEMRNFQKQDLHLCSPSPNDLFKAQTTSFPIAYLIKNNTIHRAIYYLYSSLYLLSNSFFPHLLVSY